MSHSRDKRSPLKASPLRQPGQSLDEEIYRLINDDAAIYLLVALVLALLAALEWLRFALGNPQLHWPYTAMAVAAMAGALWRREVIRRKVRNMRLGRDGERAIGQFLERMRARGFRVFHDIQKERFNIDHVLVGPEGVYTAETKTRSLPRHGAPKVAYDGVRVLVNGWEPDRDCIVQAKRQAYTLHELIAGTSSLNVWVQPIVVFPGWSVEGPPEDAETTVWVLDPKQLPDRIAEQPIALSGADITSIVDCISKYSGATSA